MPDFVPGYRVEVYAGAYDWTEFFHSADPTAEQDIIDTPTFRRRSKRVTPGQHSGSVTLEGYYYRSQDDGDTDGTDEFFVRMLTTPQRLPVTLARDGGEVGDSAICLRVYAASQNNKAATDDVVRCDVEMTADYGLDFGKVGQARTALTTTTTGSAVDLHDGVDLTTVYTAGRAYLHCFAASGTTPTNTVTVEHSDDGSSGWATAGTFTQLTNAKSYEVIDIGTLKRYIRVKSTIAGTSPSYEVVVAVCPLAA